jgi:CRISPR-associated endonuclease/helicase Cas3
LHGTPNTFWGKLRRDGTGTRVLEWHPLVDHCADVAGVLESLLGLPLWRERLMRLAGQQLSDVSRARLCVLAALHDIGKLNIGFQAKGRPELGTTAGHVTEALGALFRPEIFSCLTELSAWGGGVTDLLVTAICHHGRPYNATVADSAWQTAWWTPRSGLDPRAGAETLLSRCRIWFPKAFEADGPPLPDTPAFAHAFAGLVMLADWMGSDTSFFPFSESDDDDRMVFARAKAKEALVGMALDFPLVSRTDSSNRDPFTRVSPEGYRARSAQAAIVGLPLDHHGSITILEAETGSGKTEAVLARFVSLFEAGLVDGLYFALPTRSAATQMHRRVHEAVQRAFASPPVVILAVPGYLRVDEVEGRRLPPFEVLWPDEDRFRFRAWAAEAPKRFLAGCVVVGTIDQVLLSSLMVGHAHLRATALLRHLLVVDEVHASDAYMARILEDVLARHWAAGGHAILLSATLGSEARSRLLTPEEHVRPLAFAEAEAAPYPLITHRDQIERTIAIARDGLDSASLSRIARARCEPSPTRRGVSMSSAGVGLNTTSSVRPSKPPGRSRFRGRQSARRWSCPASFTGPDPIAHRVIATGQVLDGDVVVGVEVWRWLNDRGQVAFVAHFLTWSALYRADPSQRGCWRARARVARIDSVNKITRSQETNLRRGRHRRDAANESH